MPLVTLTTPVLKFDLGKRCEDLIKIPSNLCADTSQDLNYIEEPDYHSESYKKASTDLKKLFVPRGVLDPSPSLESRYTEYMNSLSFPNDEEGIIEGTYTQVTNETDLLDVAIEFNTVPYLDPCECFFAVRPVNVASKFKLKEVKVANEGLREADGRVVYLLEDFETRLWEDEISFHDPTVKPLKGILNSLLLIFNNVL